MLPDVPKCHCWSPFEENGDFVPYGIAQKGDIEVIGVCPPDTKRSFIRPAVSNAGLVNLVHLRPRTSWKCGSSAGLKCALCLVKRAR